MTDIDVILNILLVKEGIRPACLIQSEILLMDDLKKQFPEMYFYQLNCGILTYSTETLTKYEYSDIEIGKIIGYPCAENYPRNNIRIDRYVCEIFVDNKQIFAMVCSDKNHEHEQFVIDFSNKIKDLLKSEKYPILNSKWSVEHSISVDCALGKLIEKVILQDIQGEEKETIYNYLWNANFTENQVDNLRKNFDWNDYRNIIMMVFILNNIDDFYFEEKFVDNFMKKSTKISF